MANTIFECTPLMSKRVFALAVVAISCISTSGAARADGFPFDFVQATHLTGVGQGSSLSDMAKALGNGGFETSGGSNVRFNRWYAAEWVDTRFDFMTQITPSFGVLWGFSTGERGEKYAIDPSFKYGFLAVYPLTKSSKLSFSATAIIGGRFQERSCTADYGDIGGVQQVNCRMAASEMAPAQTLAYLINQDPANKSYASLQYTFNF